MASQRPKPWEVSSGTSAASVGATSSPSAVTASTTTAGAPDLPTKPSSLTGNATTSATSTLAGSSYTNPYSSTLSSGYGMSPYGYGSMGSSYGSYGSMGSYGSGLYGSRLGGMGGLYGSSYSSPYGMSGYGMSGYGTGLGGVPNGGMVSSITQSTEATFQLIESIIGTFAGFSQMLESFYYATHNSFFTMITVAEQFKMLKDGLGSALGIVAVMGFLKKCLAKLKLIKEKKLLSADEFISFERNMKAPNGGDKTPEKNGGISLKPLLIFLCCAFGMPLLMKKLVTAMAKRQQERQQQLLGQQQLQQQKQQQVQPSQQQQSQPSQTPIDINKMEFARALYDFVPENEEMELKLNKGDLVAILSKTDALGKESSWWRCRSRDGRLGFAPYNYLEIIKKSAIKEKTQETNKGEKSQKSTETTTTNKENEKKTA
ncbi:unnamed protein product [Ambrosiozyma monospora]|uniref:Unnamed protein product n=1 Tax=Ambrosiozyma monospora TaxID=43982 RepID=A0ACB5STM9_AMBMO|nr:unnamed protein product [Ambrosiozyma monospora]